NGILTISDFVTSTVFSLQIVPVVTDYFISGTSSLQLYGSGFVEGAATYTYAGGSTQDTSVSAGPDVFNHATFDNTGVTLPEHLHGFGNVTVTTAGGTSAPAFLKEIETGNSRVTGLAFDPAAPEQFWYGDTNSPGKLH